MNSAAIRQMTWAELHEEIMNVVDAMDDAFVLSLRLDKTDEQRARAARSAARYSALSDRLNLEREIRRAKEDEAEALQAWVEADQLAVKSAASREEDIQKQRAYALRLAREIVEALECDALGALAKPTWSRLGNLNALKAALRECKHFAFPPPKRV